MIIGYLNVYVFSHSEQNRKPLNRVIIYKENYDGGKGRRRGKRKEEREKGLRRRGSASKHRGLLAA